VDESIDSARVEEVGEAAAGAGAAGDVGEHGFVYCPGVAEAGHIVNFFG